MIERLLLASLIIGVLLVAGGLLRWRSARRRRQVMATLRIASASLANDGHPRLLLVSGPACSACRTQRAVIDGLRARVGAPFAFDQFDATRDPERAGQLGVVVVPTTIIAAADGRIVSINSGLADLDQLQRQLEMAA